MERWLAEQRNVRIYAVLGALTLAFSGIFVSLSHASPSTAAIFRCAYALPVLGLLAWREDRRLGPRSWRERRFALTAGALFAVDLLLWNHSIEDIGAGLATALANLQVVLVPLGAWAVLSEHPGRRILAALPIVLVGVLMISGVLQHGAYGRDPAAGALYGVTAAFAYAGFLLVLRRGGTEPRTRPKPRARHPASPDAPRPRHPVAGPLFDVTAVAAAVCLVAGAIIGDARLVPTWPSTAWLLALALGSQVLGMLLITVSLQRLPAALTSLLLMLQPVGSVALAALILGESPSGLQLAGVGVVLVALIVATYDGPGSTAVRRLGYAIAGASGNRSSAAAMSSSENSRSSSRPARKAS